MRNTARGLAIVAVVLALLTTFFRVITWEGVALALGFSIFILAIELVIARRNANRAELNKYRGRATTYVAAEHLPKDVAVKLDADGRVSRARPREEPILNTFGKPIRVTPETRIDWARDWGIRRD